MKYTVPNEQQAKIIRENGIDPDCVTVHMAGEDYIRLLVFKTRDMVTVEKSIAPPGEYKAADEQQARIIRENGMDPEEYSVMASGNAYIQLLSHSTGNVMTIRKGDRSW